MTEAADYPARFGGIARVFGEAGLERLRRAHVAVVGLGGVGSWAVECLARSGVGEITLIDHDDICPTNVNRQIHALTSTLGRSKGEVLRQRVLDINPECRCLLIDDYLTTRTLEDYLGRGYDFVIDAIDSIKFKAAMIHWCRRNRIPILTTGGAGGMSDPTRIRIADLSRTVQDPLAAKVRQRLRREYGFSRNPKRRFGVDCVFSEEQPVYPTGDGCVSHAKPGIHGVHLDCRLGYGSFSGVTAVFGFMAAARVIERLLRRESGSDG